MAAQTHATRPRGFVCLGEPGDRRHHPLEPARQWCSGAVGHSLGRIAAEPGFYLQQLVAIALSAEFKAFWVDPEAQMLLAQQASEP